nr:hypothetical protein [Tanacetum cinerariifolium]
MLTNAIKHSESYQMFIKYLTHQIPPKKSRGKGSKGKKTAKESQETVDVSEESKPEPELAKKKTASIRVVKKKVTLSADDNIITDDLDAALELAKSISYTEAEEAKAVRKVHATHARIMTEYVSESAKKKSSGRSSKTLPSLSSFLSSSLSSSENSLSCLSPHSRITFSSVMSLSSLGTHGLAPVPLFEVAETTVDSLGTPGLLPVPLFEPSVSSACLFTFLESLHDVHSKEIYSNPLFDEEIISIKIDPHHFNAESDLIESQLNQDSSIISSSKIDSLFNEFVGELILLKSIPPGIDEAEYDPKEEICLIEKLLYDNSSPRPPKEFISKNSDAAIESFSPFPILVEDSDSLMEEIDLNLTLDDSMPPGIKEDDYDSEKDMLIFEELLSNDNLSLFENESFHFDIPLSRCPPAKPPDDNEIEPNSRILTVKVVGDISKHYVPMPRLLPTQPTHASNQEKSPHLLSHWGLKAFQLPSECPMMIYGGNIPILDGVSVWEGAKEVQNIIHIKAEVMDIKEKDKIKVITGKNQARNGKHRKVNQVKSKVKVKPTGHGFGKSAKNQSRRRKYLIRSTRTRVNGPSQPKIENHFTFDISSINSQASARSSIHASLGHDPGRRSLVDIETEVDLGVELQGRLEEKYKVNAAIKEVNAAEPISDRDEEPTKKRVAKEILLQESFKKLRAEVKVSGSNSTQDTSTDDPNEMSEEDVQNMLQIFSEFQFHLSHQLGTKKTINSLISRLSSSHLGIPTASEDFPLPEQLSTASEDKFLLLMHSDAIAGELCAAAEVKE